MTLQIISNIIMFACCVVMFVCNRKLKNVMKSNEASQQRAYSNLENQLYECWYVMAGNHEEPEYLIERPLFRNKITNRLPHEREVVKRVMHNGGRFDIVIKRFTDEDESFNQMCAEELVEILNDK